MMRTILVALDTDSAVTLKTAYCGFTSIGFQRTPLICRTTTDWLGSLHVTFTALPNGPGAPTPLNWMGMAPVLPGSTLRVHSPAVVQPQPGLTAVTSSVA